MNAKIIFYSALLLAASCSGRQAAPEPRLLVETVRAEEFEIAPTREFPFIAKPLRTSTLSFRVSGPVETFDVYAGNNYARGDIIASIDPRDFRLRYENAEAAYRQALADYRRIAALYEKDNLPASNYETARAAWIAAETARDAALNALNDTRLTAPFDGYVGEVYIERFQDVRASQPVVTLTDISSLRIEVYVTQEIAMQAGTLKEVELEFDHAPGRTFRAKVVECARSTTPNNLSYLLTALLPNPDGALPAGLSGRVRFDLPDAAVKTVAVPQKAICHTSGAGDHVWTIDPATGRAARRSVGIGDLLPDGRIAVKQGISSGETVAVSGMRFLEEGETVETARHENPQNDIGHS